MMETSSEIRAALYRGDRAEAQRLAAANPTDIFEAASLGDAQALRKRLADEPDLVHAWSDDGFTALHLACFLADAETVSALLDSGADPNAVARNEMKVQPLHSAAAHRDVEICRRLLEAGADPNARQKGGYMPLDEAEHTGNTELSALLRAHGAELSGKALPGQLST